MFLGVSLGSFLLLSVLFQFPGLLFSLRFGSVLPVGGFSKCLVIFSVPFLPFLSILALGLDFHTLASRAILILNSQPLS